MSPISAIPDLDLQGELMLPKNARGIVCVEAGAVDSLSDLVNALDSGGFGVLRIDLLTPAERAEVRPRALCENHIVVLAERLARATDWLAYGQPSSDLPIGYLAAGIGSAAALMAAATRPTLVSALVSCSGRPLLAQPALPQVRAPTLLIAHGSDLPLLKVNQAALSQMRCEKRLELIEAPESVSRLALRWFERHLVPAA